MTEGVRYPTFAFITGGVGQADEGIPPQPFETFFILIATAMPFIKKTWNKDAITTIFTFTKILGAVFPS